ncbi:DNA topoisomerase IV subunit B [uncultured Faecalibaculum sp.]|uniref:DNA topoisomerase IV subunit B n=1 Tax=uncultured Faecalibaculum sp. TaxID=1729681 RepID=UPI0025F01114|nr:DNA topoisomerase IV subunit B [uncultured Faecalibaculum sp.]
MTQAYNENSIVILEGLDAVRKRPGMYIGSTDRRGLHHLVWEITDNAIDEALNGFGNEITIRLHKDGSVSVQDHGRGMPVGKHSSGKSALEVIFTILHAGGKFTSQGGYRNAGGLHGVGASVVNALSSWCEVTVRDGKHIWQMKFTDGGRHATKLKDLGTCRDTGSTVRFLPDPQIFKNTDFSFSQICERAQEDAFLLQNLKMTVVDERSDTPREVSYQYEDGLKAFIEEVDKDHGTMHPPVSFSGESQGIRIAGCFQYTDGYQENIFSFANMVRTRDGGSHETGVRQAFTKAFNEYARKNGFLKEKDKGFEGTDIREGLSVVINLAIPEELLQFEGQTKEKLGTPEAKSAVESVVTENLRWFLEENRETANTLVRKILRAAAARQAARKARDEARKGKGRSRSERVLSGKLAAAQSRDARRKELYLVEGDSAGGSAKQGRDAKYQAILPLRGKVLNTEKATLEAVEKNEELNTIIHALGAGVGASFTPEDSSYYKVIIMTDADDDGAHIQNLLLTFFYRYMRGLIEQGMLYIALPPLFRIAKGKKEVYVYTDEELEEQKKLFGSGYVVQRYKGLGEMNATQLWETTMDPDRRTLLQVSIEDGRMAEKRISDLMGDRADLRREWIEENVVFTLEDAYAGEVTGA